MRINTIKLNRPLTERRVMRMAETAAGVGAAFGTGWGFQMAIFLFLILILLVGSDK